MIRGKKTLGEMATLQVLPYIPDKTIEMDMLSSYNCYNCDIKGII